MSQRSSQRLNWFLVGIAYFSLFAFGLVDNVRGPIFPDLLREYGLSDLAGGFFFLIASGASLVNNLVLYRWIERIGSYRTTQVYSLVQVLGLVVIGFGSTYPVTLLGAVLLGASMGGLGISVNLLVAEGAPHDRRRQALSGLHCMFGISSLFSPLVVSQFYHHSFGWRAVMGWVALAPLAVAAVSLLAKAEDRLPHRRSESRTVEPGAKAPWTLGLFFGAIGACYVIAEISVSTRLVLFARRDWGYEVDAANTLLSLYFLGLFVGRFAAAVFRLPWRSSSILKVSTVVGLVFYVLGITVHPAWLALTGIALSVFYPCMIAMVNEEHRAHSGYITSWCITLQSFGVMVMHFALGGLTDAFGLGIALWMGPLVLILVLLLLVSPAKSPAIPPARRA